MVENAPAPRMVSDNGIPLKAPKEKNNVFVAPSVVVCGAGGCGINMARRIKANVSDPSVKFSLFDTSMANSREGEQIVIVTGGHGSGGVRAENAAMIQKEVATLGEEHFQDADIAIVCFSLSGGTGSVLGPILLREYAKLGRRAVAVVVADTGAELFARNTLNTLRSLSAIAENNSIYLPMMMFTNDSVGRAMVDNDVAGDVPLLVRLLHGEAMEVDRNDRINFLNGTKTFGAKAGLRLLSVYSKTYTTERQQPLFSHDSSEMYDGMLNIGGPDLVDPAPAYVRFRKDGTFTAKCDGVMGLITANIAPIDQMIDSVEKMQHVAKNQVTTRLSRLESSGGDDLIL